MKLAKRAVCLILTSVILCSFTALFASADNTEYRNDSPFIFVHGLNGWGSGEGIDGVLPYWGATTGNLMDYLRSEGYECYSCSVGPLSSAWDRACELYAQLVGGRVDYGAAHSAEHHHARYGRTYDTAVVPDWGKQNAGGETQKIHLIGHSFGGTTVRVISQLMCEGAQAEIEATGADTSPLFTGGKSDFIESVTTICAPHNSSTFYYITSPFGLTDLYLGFSFTYAALAGRSLLNGTYFDFHLEQFGLTDIPGQNSADKLLPSLCNFFGNYEDSAEYDIMPYGANALNEWVDIDEDIYYFSYAFSTTKPVSIFKTEVPIPTTNPALLPFAAVMGTLPSFTDEENGFVCDASSRANDGLVNVTSALYPAGEAHTQYNSKNITTGVWNVMPLRQGDHGTAIGLNASKKITHEYYAEMIAMLNSLD